VCFGQTHEMILRRKIQMQTNTCTLGCEHYAIMNAHACVLHRHSKDE
jgi:hypothetical protein